MTNKIKIEHPEKKIPKTVLAEAIVNIGSAMKNLEENGLNEHAIIVLLAHQTRLSQAKLKTVINGMRQLESWYCK